MRRNRHSRGSSQPPYIDGQGGLLARYEGEKAIEAKVGSVIVYGLGFAALTDGIVVGLGSAAIPESTKVSVVVTHCDDNDTQIQNVEVLRLINQRGLSDHDFAIRTVVDNSVSSGPKLLERSCDVFPLISFGPDAIDQINMLTGNENYFRQVIRHLGALNLAAQGWSQGLTYAPQGVNWSVESQATLQDGNLGPLRDFRSPAGYQEARWSYHTKLAGGIRLYYRLESSENRAIILIGYLGKHLPTKKFR